MKIPMCAECKKSQLECICCEEDIDKDDSPLFEDVDKLIKELDGCKSTYRKEYYMKNRIKILKYIKESREKNLEKCREQGRIRMKRYMEKNKDKIKKSREKQLLRLKKIYHDTCIIVIID